MPHTLTLNIPSIHLNGGNNSWKTINILEIMKDTNTKSNSDNIYNELNICSFYVSLLSLQTSYDSDQVSDFDVSK